ncbi:opsin-5-like [Lampetra fluviatilis]
MANQSDPDYDPAVSTQHDALSPDPFRSKLSPVADMVAGVYLTSICVLSLLGNGLVLTQCLMRKRKLKPAEIITVNLAISDFCLSVVGKPFSAASSFAHKWLFGGAGCRWYGFTGFFFGCGSLGTLTMVSFERYLKICHIAYSTWVRRRHAFLCVLAVWSYAAFWATMPLLGWGSYAPEPFGTSCTLDWWLAQSSAAGRSFVLCMLVFCLLLPAAAILFAYARIVGAVRRSARDLAHFERRARGGGGGVALELRITKVAMMICAGFLLAWIPYAVVSVWSAFGAPDSVPVAVSLVPTMFAKSAAMYNPLIYQLLSRRGSGAHCCCCCRCRKARSTLRRPRLGSSSHVSEAQGEGGRDSNVGRGADSGVPLCGGGAAVSGTVTPVTSPASC